MTKWMHFILGRKQSFAEGECDLCAYGEHLLSRYQFKKTIYKFG